MHLMYFTEQPMSAYSEKAGRDFGATALMFPNTNFDPVQGSRLYNNYIEQYMLAEEVGVDGIMLNEHHNAPFCMQAKANIFASILAAVTKTAKIILLGNPLPLADRQLLRQVLFPVAHLYKRQQFCGLFDSLARTKRRFKHRNLHVLERRKRRQQVERLKDKP